MSLSRWIARTRGVVSPACTAGVAASAPRASKTTRNPRKLRPVTGVRILSAEVHRSCPRTAKRQPWEPVRRLFLAFAVLVAALLAAPAAFGSDGARVVTVVLRPGAPDTSRRFTLAGVQWRGPGRVVFRTRSVEGRWSTWRAGAPEDEDRPDVGVREHGPSGWRLGNPYW